MYNHTYRPIYGLYRDTQQILTTAQGRRRWYPLFLATLLLLCSNLGLGSQAVHAQSMGEPPLTIAAVDTSGFPTISLTVAGTDWPAARATAPLQIRLNGEAQAILSDDLTQQGIQFMVAIDPNELFRDGQSRYTEMTGALLDLIENNILLRNQDWLAAYLLSPSAVQSIQAWTQEPNLVFNSIIQNRPTELTDTPLTAPTLINALQQFEASPPPSATPRVLLLISAGAAALDIAPVVATAQTLAVQIHVVQLQNSAEQASDDNPLVQLAQATGGQYIALNSPTVLPPLWERIAAAHNQRMLTFQATVADPQTLEIRLQLPDGTTLSDNLGAATFANIAAGAAPAAQTVLTDSEIQAAVADGPTTTQPATQVVAALPANPAALPASAPSDSAAPDSPGAIVIPGLQIALPRSVLQVSLPVLLLLIAYFVYAETRDRRKKRARSKPQTADRYKADDPLYTLDENSQPLPTGRFQLQGQDAKVEQRFSVDLPLPDLAAPITPPPARPPARAHTFVQEPDEADATMRPPRLEDEEATYRVQEVDQPILGYLVRASSDPNLPKELPVYGLNPAPGQVRQIHIGRHSKHNTVVINDKSISREHAVIVQRDGRLYLRDNASTSGTFLNWKRLNPGEEMLLRHNDLLSFGQIVYEFRLHGEDEVTIAEA